ncbi:MAG: hypothetical protein CL573_02265 [Alphaproteobacteria bacterium]|nr:hypothetical protein [Alphaproteobacteria bacterium]HCP01525.1 DUF3501 domain-containing protein [Rhodospirillaceae bacterium]|tara:strand:- start:91 stop:690 length:600 start_codon:yes stop_codon:yes gene_type:complete
MPYASPRAITRADLIDMEEYGLTRKKRRAALVARKKNRRVELGPYATAYFECYETMWQQVHEMLFIERGGEEQIDDELAAYNPLIPNGRELVATVMFEIDDEVRRRMVLSKLGGVEEMAFLKFAGETVAGVPEADIDRTNVDGKASSVQFIHFPFTDFQAEAFREAGTEATLGFTHPDYAHMTVLTEVVRVELAGDLDA